MSLAAKIWVLLMAVGFVLSGYTGKPKKHTYAPTARRRITVEDTIEMTRIGGPLNAGRYAGVGPGDGFAFPSPNRKRVAIVLRRANLEENTNVYSLWVLDIRQVLRGASARRLVDFASSSNRDGIALLTWLADNDTIVFLGSRRSAPSQLYSIRCSTRRVTALTRHPRSITFYAITPDGRTVLYSAERSPQAVMSRDTLRDGFWMDRENPADVVSGEVKSNAVDVFVQKTMDGSSTRLSPTGPLDERTGELSVSPNGRYVVVKTNAVDVPESWRDYDDDRIRAAFHRRLPPNEAKPISQYELFDFKTGKHALLLDAPVSSGPTPPIWSSDSHSVVLWGVHLPLDVNDPIQRDERRVHKYVVEIRLPEGKTEVISDENVIPVKWQVRGEVVSFRRAGERQCEGGQSASVWYERRSAGWKRRSRPAPDSSDACPDISVDQGLNEPARIVMKNRGTDRTLTLFDLNPQFAGLSFAKVEHVHWRDSKGGVFEGGLYLPIDYAPGKKYPLVIQTHGFDPSAFWLEGPHTTVFAAQPLAAHGMVVLQLNDIFYDSLVTPEELDRAMSVYEKVIEDLDKRGLIDTARVGLVGFSRTGMYVKYTLTHSRKSFAAAVVADANDGGYWQYILTEPFLPRIGAEMETMFGAPPFGDGLRVWAEKSPGFLLERVKTPVLIEALGPFSLLNEWEWFSGLRRLHRPVDLVYLPTGTHVLIKPWDRQVSMEATLDWFCFWLTDEEHATARKAAQYQRWRGLREYRLH